MSDATQAAGLATLGARIRRNTLWVFSGRFANRLFGFAAGVVLARLLLPEDFGLLVTTQVFTGLAGFVAGAGMGEALIRKPGIGEEHLRAVFTAQLIIGAGIYFGFFLLAPHFAASFSEPRYELLLRVSALSFLLRPFRNIPNVMLRRQMRFRPLVLIDTGQLIFSSILSIVFALMGWGVWALIISGLVSSVVGVIALLQAAAWCPMPTRRLGVLGGMAMYGVKTTANDLAVYASTQLPNLVISRLEGPALVGLFNKADSLNRMPFEIVTVSTYQTVFSALSSLQADLGRSWYIFLRTVSLSSLYTFPLYAGLFWVAEPFVRVAYGERWLAAAPPLEILSLVGLTLPLANVSGAVAAAQNRLGIELWIQTQFALLVGLGALAGLQWGLPGVAFGLALAYLYRGVRMTVLAVSALHGNWRQLGLALRAPVLLNALLNAVAWCTASALPAAWPGQSPVLFILVMTTVCCACYVVSLMLLPFEETRSEVVRLRQRLGFAPAG